MSVNTLHQGYLYCNGALYPNINYPDLFDVIGYAYGQFNSNFKVPTVNNSSFLRGYNPYFTEQIGTQPSDNIKQHTHSTKYSLRSRGSDVNNVLSIYDPLVTNLDYTKIIDSSNNTGELLMKLVLLIMRFIIV